MATGSPSCDPTRSSPRRRLPDAAADAAVARYGAGSTSLAALARTLGVTRAEARALLAGRGVAVRLPGRPYGRSALAQVLTESFLRAEVVERGRRVGEVAAGVGCSAKTVRTYLAKWGITAPRIPAGARPDTPGRAAGGSASRRSGTGLSREALWDAYVVQRVSTTAIAAAAGCAPSTVVRDLRRHDIPVRSRGGGPPAPVRRRDRRAGIRRALVRADT